TTKRGVEGENHISVNYSQGLQQLHSKIPMTTASQYAQLYNLALTNSGEKPFYSDPESLGKGTDWQNVIFQVAPERHINLSLSGGNEKNTYFISGGYFQQDGIIKHSAFNRMNIRVNSSHKIIPSVTIGENISASLNHQKSISEFGIGGIVEQT